jgi:predicted GH43/DUF377 family glycosyl hydrolase
MSHKTKPFFSFLKNKKSKTNSRQYKLLNVFGFQKNDYLLRFNQNSLEIVNLKNQKILKTESHSDFKKAFEWKNTKVSKLNKNCLILSFEIRGQIKNYISENLVHWDELELEKNLPDTIHIAENYKYQENNLFYYQKENNIYYQKFENFLANNNVREVDLISENENIRLAGVFNQNKVLFLFYYVYQKNNQIKLKVAILDKENPSRLVWKIKQSVWNSKTFDKRFYPIGIIKKNTNYKIFCKDSEEKIYYTELPTIKYRYEINHFKELKNLENYQRKNLFLEKSSQNPIITPRRSIKWETNGTFNPAAILLKNKIHLLYRAVRDDHMSVIGYASTKNGTKIEERSNLPIYTPSASFEFIKNNKFSFSYPYMSGGGWGGCEDPRLSLVENKIYMTYTAFNGRMAPGVAMTSIKIEDFLNKNWNWTEPRLISEPGKIQKNWVIFPEKINGKYAILHSISPEISIDYFDNLDSQSITIKSHYSKNADNLVWENYLRGIAAPPIKTNKGWLIFYHAVDHKNPNQYKLGAMILNLKNPSKIICRSNHPILEPNQIYENNGKPGVIYVCGVVLRNDKLYIYYGGADKVSCLATVKLKTLLNYLNSKKEVCLKNIKIKK